MSLVIHVCLLKEVHKAAPSGRVAAESGSGKADPGRVDGVWAGLSGASAVRRAAVISK